MKFTKLQATGNDFILIDGRGMKRDWSSLARVICRRHLGIGADGLLVMLPSAVADLGVQLTAFVGDAKPALITSRLTRRLGALPQSPPLHAIDTAAHFFPDRMRTEGTGEEGLPEISCLVTSPTPALETAKRSLLEAAACPVDVPSGVGVTLLGDRYVVVQNFGPESVAVRPLVPGLRDLTIGPWTARIVDL